MMMYTPFQLSVCSRKVIVMNNPDFRMMLFYFIGAELLLVHELSLFLAAEWRMAGSLPLCLA
ncbi:hypothetical protein ACLK1S_09555 [Escherichia coli]